VSRHTQRSSATDLSSIFTAETIYSVPLLSSPPRTGSLGDRLMASPFVSRPVLRSGGNAHYPRLVKLRTATAGDCGFSATGRVGKVGWAKRPWLLVQIVLSAA